MTSPSDPVIVSELNLLVGDLLPQEVIILIVDFATQSICVLGALVDVLDITKRWSIGKVIIVEQQRQRSRVHFIGWPSNFDAWVEWNSNDVKNAFEETIPNHLPNFSNEISDPPEFWLLSLEDMMEFGVHEAASRYVLAVFSHTVSPKHVAAFNLMICWKVLGPDKIPFKELNDLMSRAMDRPHANLHSD
eukprot:TRINITY_DN12415_c0_g1_i1.p1 TRINITY_DN12415_c0_g1~~TRINITY_DN12415_c0_g1_i1.p1  ORF type:complete len:190 (+),score=40.62 TRINITY_DN12415_c0_g1_i1:70-639(+)